MMIRAETNGKRVYLFDTNTSPLIIKRHKDKNNQFAILPFSMEDDGFVLRCFLELESNLPKLENIYELDLHLIKIVTEGDPSYSKKTQPEKLLSTLNRLLLKIKVQPQKIHYFSEFNLSANDIVVAIDDMIKKITYCYEHDYEFVSIEYDSFML